MLHNDIAQILSGITNIAMQNNYRIMLCPIDINQQQGYEHLNLARSKLVDGMIIFAPKIGDPNIDVLANAGFPFVLVCHKKYSKVYNFVDSRNIKGAHIAVQYLYDKGHKDIAFVAGSLDSTNAKDRLKGFKEAMNNFGLICRDDWIVYGDFEKEQAYRESEKLLRNAKKPTAIFCSDDYMAMGVMKRIIAIGLSVPEDIAIVGFDDIDIAAHIKPALTTVRQHLYKLGKTSAQVLLNLINGSIKSPVHKFINVELVKRESA